jgi:general secretion pathway protein H
MVTHGTRMNVGRGNVHARLLDSPASWIKPGDVSCYVLQSSDTSGAHPRKQPSKNKPQSVTISGGIASICNAAAHSRPERANREGLAPCCSKPGQRGFTLLELMVVVAIVALATALVTLALPDNNSRALTRDADRLAALLEAARAQSRAAGVPVTWHPTASGFAFDGLPASNDSGGAPWPDHWVDPNTQAALLTPGSAPLVLGPDPVIGPQAVLLYQMGNSAFRLRVATDGLRPFTVENAP